METKRRSRHQRKHGRPDGGRAVFQEARISLLPDEGTGSEVARALGIKRSSLSQWMDLKRNPIPFTEKDGQKIFTKVDVVKWLESSRRYRPKPEYTDTGTEG